MCQKRGMHLKWWICQHFTVLRRDPSVSHGTITTLLLEPLSGRPHQLRRHMEGVKHYESRYSKRDIVYWKKRENLYQKRGILHFKNDGFWRFRLPNRWWHRLPATRLAQNRRPRAATAAALGGEDNATAPHEKGRNCGGIFVNLNEESSFKTDEFCIQKW